MSTSNTIFSVFSFIGVILGCIPFPWHLKAWNVGTCLYSAWVTIPLLVYCLNSIIWREDAMNRAPVWCDISSRILVAGSFGISAASLCINRGLYNITSQQTISWSKAQKQRAIIIDLAIGIGIPILFVGLEYIVQIYRFFILQEIGCYPAVLATPLAVVLLSIPPIVLSSISAYYAVRSIIIRRRKEEEIKRDLFSTPNFNANLWYRLLALAGLEILIFLPYNTYIVVTDITSGLQRWISWKDTHSDISVIQSVTAIPSGDKLLYELSRWTRVLLAFYFFALFGLTRDARARYQIAWNFLLKCIGCGTQASPTRKISPLRFRSISNRLSFGGSRTGGDLNVSMSSAREDNTPAIFNSTPAQGGIREEPVP